LADDVVDDDIIVHTRPSCLDFMHAEGMTVRRCDCCWSVLLCPLSARRKAPAQACKQTCCCTI